MEANLAAFEPIDRAPRDGTEIIGARFDGREWRDIGKYAFETRFGADEWIEDERGASVRLTHYIPLPRPA